MYIKICKGDAISLNFEIVEYKIPEFEMLNKERDKEVSRIIDLIADCGYPFQIIGISEKERNYMVRYFNIHFTETDVNYGILAKCLDMFTISWENTWYICNEGGYDVIRIADYLEHTKLMTNWAEKCIEFLKEKGNN